MESARFSIDNDNVFYLEHIPGINGLIKNGITLFVQKDFPGYNDMSLIQYAIAKRKPKTLEFMIKKVKDDEKMTVDQIIFPRTSNTRGNLLKLAVLFCSKSDYYDSIDNRCLDVLLKKIDISDTKIFEKPLIQAISSNNEGAIELLMKKSADLFSPLDENEYNIQDEYTLSEMPIMILFKLNNNINQLKHIFDDLIPKQKSIAIIQRLGKMTVNGKDIRLSLKKYDKADEFISSRITNENGTIKDVDNTTGKKVEEDTTGKKKEEEEEQKEKKCIMCGEKAEYMADDGTWRCFDHQNS